MFEHRGSYYKLKECQLIGDQEIYPYPVVTITPKREVISSFERLQDCLMFVFWIVFSLLSTASYLTIAGSTLGEELGILTFFLLTFQSIMVVIYPRLVILCLRERLFDEKDYIIDRSKNITPKYPCVIRLKVNGEITRYLYDGRKKHP